MKRYSRKGFTIVELLMVIGVLGILITIVTTAASSAVRQARSRRTEAMRTVLQAGLETYYTKKGKWPGQLDKWASKAKADGESAKSSDYLSNDQADNVFQELVRESVKVGKSPLLDVTGLYVAQKGSAKDDKSGKAGYGLEFTQAIINGKHHKKITLSNMAFGYSEHKTGWFRRFIIKYNFKTDSVSVLTQNEGGIENDYRNEMNLANESCRWPDTPKK